MEYILSDRRFGEKFPQRVPHPKEDVDSSQKPMHLRLPSVWKDYHKDGNLQALLEQTLPKWLKQERLDGWRGYFYIHMSMEQIENTTIPQKRLWKLYNAEISFKEAHRSFYSDAVERWIFPCVSFSRITLALLESGLPASKWCIKLEVYMWFQ